MSAAPDLPNYQHVYRFLRDGAVSDGKHDFGTLGFDSKNGLDLVKRGLYKHGASDYPTSAKSEADFLKVLFPAGVDLANIKESIKSSVRKYNVTVKGIIPYEYTVKILHKDADYNVKSIISDKKLTVEDFREFFGTDVINFLIDASSIGIMELIASLKKGSGTTDLKINLLVNRESRNDPAGKITEFIKIDTTVAEKLKTDVLIDRDTSDIRYMHNSPGLIKTPLQRDKFFSIYDFVLAPVLYQENRAGSVKTKFITTRMDILDNTGKQVEPSVTDPKSEYNITSCWKIISKFFESDKEKASRAFLKKRGGDWFQALSCLDLKRNYGSTTTGAINPITGSITLITHDIILLTYALFIGLDAVFTHMGHFYYFFNNTSDNRQTPEERAAVLAKMAADARSAQEKLDAELRAKAEAYDRSAHIATIQAFMTWVAALKSSKARAVVENPLVITTNAYFKKLWEYASIDCRDFTSTVKELETLRVTSLTDCERLLALKADLDQWFSNPAARMQESTGTYQDDPGYRVMDSPNTHIRGSRGDIDIQRRAVEMVDLFSKRLPLEIYNKFRADCLEKSAEEIKQNPKYLIHYIATLVKGITSVYELTPEAPEAPTPLTQDDIEPIVDFTKCLVPVDGVTQKGASTLGALGQLILDYSSQGGGGKRINNNIFVQAGQSFLVNLFLNTLYTNISEIDSENNLDYDYYKKLISLIYIYFEKNETQRNRAYVLYKILPAYKTIPKALQFLSDQICLESIGCKSKDVKMFSFIKEYHTAAEYTTRTREIDAMTFKDSKKALLKLLEGYFEVVELVEKDEDSIATTPKTRKKRKASALASASLGTPESSMTPVTSGKTIKAPPKRSKVGSSSGRSTSRSSSGRPVPTEVI